MKQDEIIFSPLDVIKLPLAQRHLIEASAGTGKTFNITRIAVKVLLVKQISITQLLIVTFTKAATQELKARIAATLQEFLMMLDESSEQWDPLLTNIIIENQLVTSKKARLILRQAILEMDEAAIFTINSFCGRMITQSSFLTHRPFEQSIIDDSQSIYMAAIHDQFLKYQNNELYRNSLSVFGVETPEGFFATFQNVLFNNLPIEYPNESNIDRLITQSFQPMFASLKSTRRQCSMILSEYIDEIKTLFETNYAKVNMDVDRVLHWLDADEYFDDEGLVKALFHGTRLKGIAKHFAVSNQEDYLETLKTFIGSWKQTDKIKMKTDEVRHKLPHYRLIVKLITDIKVQASDDKQRQGVLDHADTVNLLYQEISSGNAQLIEYIRTQYPIALIDEFQDTDAQQYSIFHQVYPPQNLDVMLLMIGDPKQAIYGFRGGDVFTYLSAVKDARFHWSMDTNYRSTPSVINGYNTLFYGLDIVQDPVSTMTSWVESLSQDPSIPAPVPEKALFDYQIQYNWILSTPLAKANKTPLHDPISQAGTQFFHYEKREDDQLQPAMLDKISAQILMSKWVANEIQRLLTTATLGNRAVLPADIAILVNKRAQGDLIKRVFAQCGLNSVILSNRTSIFTSQQAINLHRFLQGLLYFNQDRHFKSMLATDLMGLAPADLYELEHRPEDIEQYKLAAHQLFQKWQDEGVLVMLTHVLKTRFTLFGQCLDAERIISNYMQLADLLNEQERTNPLPSMTVNFLYEKLAGGNDADEYYQRLESDNELIKIVTIHGSKGLEYPIVFVPFDSFGQRDPISPQAKYTTFYDHSAQEKRHFLARLPLKDAIQIEQERSEALRLLYVAITRAAHRCYLGYQSIHHPQHTAIHQMFSKVAHTRDQSVIEYMHTLANADDSLFASHNVCDSLSLSMYSKPSTEPVLAALTYAGPTQSQWRLYSYSSIVNRTKEIDLKANTHNDDKANGQGSQPNQNNSLPLRFTLTKGANAGQLLHNVLENSDFIEPLDDTLITQECLNFLPEHIDDVEAIQAWLDEVLATPIYHPKSDRTFKLNQLPKSCTLREPQFYFPLGATSIASLGDLLKYHRSVDKLPMLASDALEGMMQGFIDLIFEFNGQYFVCDYKSTYLGDRFEDYTPTELFNDIQSKQYDLQYLIYVWVLHLHLSLILPDYEPSKHLGGVYYLYLRGMSPQAPKNSGIYFRDISMADLKYLSQTFTPLAMSEPEDK